MNNMAKQLSVGDAVIVKASSFNGRDRYVGIVKRITKIRGDIVVSFKGRNERFDSDGIQWMPGRYNLISERLEIATPEKIEEIKQQDLIDSVYRWFQDEKNPRITYDQAIRILDILGYK